MLLAPASAASFRQPPLCGGLPGSPPLLLPPLLLQLRRLTGGCGPREL